MTFGDKNIVELLSEKEMVAIAGDIRANSRKVRNAFGQSNNQAFLLPMLVLQNVKMLEELTSMKELMAKLVDINSPVEEVKKEVKAVATNTKPKAK